MRDSPEALFADLLARRPAPPFVTYYDEATGERAELSAKSAANWVAKTHHLLSGELGLSVGDGAVIDLPAHWISVPVVLGCWTAGLSIVAPGAPAEVAFVMADASAPAGVDTYAISPGPAAVGVTGDAPAGMSDYVSAIRPQPDSWATVAFAAGPFDPALHGVTRADLVASGRSRASGLGLAEGGRLLSTGADWIGDLVAVLAVGGSLVYVRNAPDETLLGRRAAQERADVVTP